MKNVLLRKSLVVGIIILFIVASIVPIISGTISKISSSEIDKNILNKDISSSGQIRNSLLTVGDENSSSLSFHTFDKTEEKQCNIVLPTDTANDIFDMLEELKYKIFYEPNSKETQTLKNEFVDLLDAYSLIPVGLSKSDVLELLDPFNLQNKQKNYQIINKFPVLTSFLSGINKIFVGLQHFFKNYFGKTILNNFDSNILPSPSYSDTATATFCSISSVGSGAILPLFLLPRPRVAATWIASEAVTLVGELLTGKGFLAEGVQTGTVLGFIGMGLTWAFPGFTTYGFIGYAVYTKVNAEHIDFFEPPNQVPVISDENPLSGTKDVPLSLSELSFRISDSDGDRMDYTVTTDPDIGSGSGNWKNDGVYTIPISGLECDKTYSWTVEVTDGKDTTEKQFIFFTQEIPPFDPFGEGWQYRKKVTINHNKVDGDLNDFPVIISVVDSDLHDKAQDDGDDILFMDDIGVANKMKHEIEKYDDSSGELVAWLRIPSLSSSEDTDFYMYYGNSGCSSQQLPEKVWDSDYIAVYHMHDSSGNIKDSTAYSNNAIGSNGNPSYMQTLDVGYAINFDGDDCFDLPSYHLNDNNFALTTTVLVKWDSCDPGDYHYILQMEKNVRMVPLYYESLENKVIAWVGISDPDPIPAYSYGQADTTNSHLYQMHIKEGDEIAVWLDGILKDHKTMTQIETTYNRKNTLACFNDDPPNRKSYFKGTIDEVRISIVKRSDSWIKTTFKTITDPYSFFSIGPEESGP